MKFCRNTVMACLTAFLIAAPAYSGSKKQFLDAYEPEEVLPVRFEGHDIAKLLAALQNRPEKDQFETTPEYESHLASWKKKSMFGHVKPGDRLALVTDMMHAQPKASYDADAGIMAIESDPGCAANHGVQLRLWSKTLSAKGKPARLGIDDVCLVFTRRVSLDSTETIPIPRADAQYFSLQGGVLYVGHLTDDPLQVEHHESASTLLAIYTISMDVETIVYFDPRTGREFSRIDP